MYEAAAEVWQRREYEVGMGGNGHAPEILVLFRRIGRDKLGLGWL